MSAWDDVLDDQQFNETFWREYLADNPDVMHRILADLWQVTATAKDRPPTLDDLWEMVGPKFSNEPFAQAVRDALGGRSIRWLAGRIGLDHAQIMRHMRGTAPIVRPSDPIASMRRLELIARGLGVHPSYFAEWRRLWVMALIDGALAERPHLSIGMYRKFAQHEPLRRDTSPRRNGR